MATTATYRKCSEDTEEEYAENIIEGMRENIDKNEEKIKNCIPNGEKRNSGGIWKKSIVLPLIVIAISVLVGQLFPSLYEEIIRPLDEDIDVPILKLFHKHDLDRDGVLCLQEFKGAFYEMKNLPSLALRSTLEAENSSYKLNVSEELDRQLFMEDEEVLSLKTFFKPMDIDTMRKSKEDTLLMDSQSVFHLHGLTNWLAPNIDAANFSVANFSVFMPQRSLGVGSTWQLIEKVLGGVNHEGVHLEGFRYIPPYPANPTERLIFFLLSMIHKKPFLHMRFPPRGAVACLKAYNDDYYSIVFRLHPEFQLNDPPHFPFWFTPASIIGELIIAKDAAHIEYFKMYLPTHFQLNIDMEWFTRDIADKESGGPDGNGEVDIGFMEEMKIESAHPSRKYKGNITDSHNSPIVWTQEMPTKDVLRILEREFYPFKQIPYLPFNQTFEAAKLEEKLIHHVVLWGSLDDQSC